jgi:choline dehydrogenase-like flavoprotein
MLLAKCLESYEPEEECADYIVIGVGTAGAVVAKKLSDDKQTSVIALHIGTNETENPLIKYSIFSEITVGSALIGPPFYATGDSVPQPKADFRRLEWVMALPEGGASSINAGAYCRGTNELFARWEEIAGPEWSVARVLEQYKELEHYYGKTPNPAFRGFHGPLTVRQNPEPSNVSKKFTKAIIEATHTDFVVDYNDPETPIGASSQFQYTQNPSGILRVSSVNAFLNDEVVTPDGYGVNGRKLRIFFESTGLKTIWKGNKAVGVEYLQNGKSKKVFANKGVIVCAGLRSSTFLMHSGIGPKKLLKGLKIPVIFDNPNVGQGLADQPAIRLLFSSNPEDFVPPTTGFFAQIAWLPAVKGDPRKRELRIATINAVPGITLLSFDLCQPRSRGTITIDSNDPLAKPVINMGMLTDPANEDLKIFQEGLQVYIKNINKKIHKIDHEYGLLYPSPELLDDKKLVNDFIRANINTNQHFQSHCRMTRSLEEGGVVDPTGRVFGVQNLYIADDSIVPLCMDGSPMASAYLIGSNVSRLIIEGEQNVQNIKRL